MLRISGRAGVRVACSLMGWLCAAACHAGGLLALEVGVTRNGTAGAGSAAYASDASTVFYNPAGMARLERAEIVIGANLILSEVEFGPDVGTNIPGGSGGDAGSFAPAPASFYARPLTEDFAVGVGLGGLFAGSVEYDGGWSGRFFATEVSATALGVSVGGSYRVTDRLSVGANVILGYMILDMELRLPSLLPSRPEGEVELDGDDFEPGFQVGLLYELSDRTRIGLNYTSEIEFDLSGDIDVDNPPLPLLARGVTEAEIGTDFLVVQHAMLSLYHELGDVTLLVDLGWDDWSDFKYTTLVGSGGRQLSIPRHWEDTWHVGLGFEYSLNERWLLQAGTSYDSSPVDDVESGFPDLPVDRQWRFALGAVYDWSDETRVGVSYTYLDGGSSPLDLSLGPGRLKGEYDTNRIHFLAFWVAF